MMNENQLIVLKFKFKFRPLKDSIQLAVDFGDLIAQKCANPLLAL